PPTRARARSRCADRGARRLRSRSRSDAPGRPVVGHRAWRRPRRQRPAPGSTDGSRHSSRSLPGLHALGTKPLENQHFYGTLTQPGWLYHEIRACGAQGTTTKDGVSVTPMPSTRVSRPRLRRRLTALGLLTLPTSAFVDAQSLVGSRESLL